MGTRCTLPKHAMDIPELQGFTPRASTSRTPASAFAIDPALAGLRTASSASRGRDNYWGEDDGIEYDDEDDDYDSQGLAGEDEPEEDETDAEEEFAATQQAGTRAKRGRASQGGLLGPDGSILSAEKGKGRAVDQDDDGDEDEENLGRLITAIRDSASSGVGGSTALDREFDRSIADELDAFDPEMMEDLSVGIKGRKRRKGVRGGGRRAAADVEPSPEVKRLLGTANQAYAEGRLEEAIEGLTEVVRIDPIIRVSWYTLATVYEELGEREKAVQCKIVATALLGAKKGAGEWADLGRESRDIGLLHQAIYCFTQAIKANKEDVDSMWDRAILLKLSGATKMAVRAFSALLQLLPHDPGVLRELAPLLASSQLYSQATATLLAALSYYRLTVPLVSSSTVDALNTYGYSDLETLADFLLLQKNYAEVVRVVRQGVRWLQGRERETGWDAIADDREFDMERKAREGWEKENQYFEEEPTYELDVRLRSRLGVARLHMGWVEEAQRHFDLVLEEDVSQFPELFGAIGEAYYENKMFEHALEVFQLMAECDETNGPAVWYKIAQCHQATGDWEDAKECYEHVVEEEPENVEAKLALARILEQLNEPARAMQLVRDVMNRRAQQDEDDDESEGPGGARRRRRTWHSREERQALQKDREEAERSRHAEFTAAFARLEHLDVAVSAGDEESKFQWLEIATRLVDSFRSTRQLFPSDFRKKFVGMMAPRYGRRGRKGAKENRARDLEDEADLMANRLQRSMIADEDNEVEETSFRGLDFDGWVDFILKYCFLLTRSDELELATEVLLHVREASVFRQSQEKTEALRLGLIACYYHAGKHNEIVAELRWWLLNYPYQTEPIRLVLALLSQGQNAANAFNDGRLQKFLIRQLKAIQAHSGGRIGPKEGGEPHDGQTPAPVTRGGSPETSRGRGSSTAAGGGREDDQSDAGEDDDDEGKPVEGTFKPTVLSPVFFATYAFMLNTSQSFQPAIIYLLRAYEIDKTQPLINLALGIAYLQRAMSRQTDNRQHQIAQGLAFLNQYRKLRGPSQEAEYNLARAFHHLGLQSHAMKHYESSLSLALPAPPPSLADAVDVDENAGADADATGSALKEFGDLTKAAAYNLTVLHAVSGQPELARKVAERWLVAV
ncbi:hypothetical protein JCM1841_000569 [Sporobolomyces salmonicolor]